MPGLQPPEAPAPASGKARWLAIFEAVQAALTAHPAVVELAALGLVLLIAGIHVVPAHVATLWHDPEFVGWVVPIANRVAAGQRLYVDGGHTAMPPLPALLLLPAAGRGTWLLESAMHFLFQGATVLCIYLAFHRHLPRLVALAVVLATLLNFLSIQKAILYDPMAQFFVALTIQQLLAHLMDSEGRTRKRRWRPLVCAGAATAALFLTKQSTAAGVLFGVPCALVLARGMGLRARIRATGVYLAAAAATTAVLLLLMLPWVSAAGFWTDVVATGAEVKGGRAALFASAKQFLATILTSSFQGPLPGGAILAALVALMVIARVRSAPVRTVGQSAAPLRAHLGAALTCAGLFFAAIVTTVWLDIRYPDQALEGLVLLAIEVVVLLRCLPSATPAPANGPFDLFFAALCVAVPAALGHNLSVNYLRWVYDNNPLVPITLVVVAALLCEAAQALAPTVSRLTLGVLTLVLLQGVTAGRVLDRWNSLESCTERWVTVKHLAGARVPRAASGMGGLVKLVRRLTEAKDEVLLLPDDPNAHAWFERRRPALTSQIIFTDQYHDRFVDEDARRLVAQPPKVIVIGPRGAWRPFSRIWHQNVGTERLIDRLQADLLPARYSKAAEVAINYHGATDYMDVFLLKPPLAPAP
jgi:hypothetical protein